MTHKLFKITNNINIFFSSSRRISVGMGILRLLRSVLSLYTISLSAKYFGVSIERDAWVIGGTIIAVFTGFLFGPIVNIFRTKFVHIREEEGEDKAIQATSALLGGIVLVSLVIIIISEIYPQIYTNIFAPGFKPSQTSVLLLMVRCMIPSLLINQIVVIWTAILNSYDSFFMPDIFGFISGLLNIIFILILAPYINIYSLILSSYLSSIIFSFLLIRVLYRRNIKLYSFHFSWIDFKPYLIFALPLYLNYFAGQFLSVVERRLCTYLDTGTVSAFDYAKRFGDLTLNVILSIVPMVLTPILAGYFAKKLFKEFNKELLLYVRMFMIGIIPIVIVFTIGSDDIVQILFSKGAFDPQFKSIISDTLFWMGVGIIGVVLYVISGEALVAQKKVKLITIASSIAYLIIASIDIMFYKKFGAPLFACSWAIVHIVLGLVLVFIGNNVVSKFQFLKELLRIGFFYIVTFFLSYSIKILFQYTTHTNLILLKMSVMVSIVIIAICVLIYVLKMEERFLINKILGNLIKRKNKNVK